jgi:hypothetical protein
VAQMWDNNGNLLNDGVFTYIYDSANQLTSAIQGTNIYTFSLMTTIFIAAHYGEFSGLKCLVQNW